MRATTIHAPRDIRLSQVPDPSITAPTDAVVRVVAACICGSDLWPYRGENPIQAGSTTRMSSDSSRARPSSARG